MRQPSIFQGFLCWCLTSDCELIETYLSNGPTGRRKSGWAADPSNSLDKHPPSLKPSPHPLKLRTETAPCKKTQLPSYFILFLYKAHAKPAGKGPTEAVCTHCGHTTLTKTSEEENKTENTIRKERTLTSDPRENLL